MNEIAKLIPQGENPSARITITNEFTVINGEHYRIFDGYVHKQDSPATVKTKDILSIEKQTIRLKKILVRSLILFGLIPVVFWISGMINPAVNTAETVSRVLSDPQGALNEMIDDVTKQICDEMEKGIINGAADIAARKVFGDDAVDILNNAYAVYEDYNKVMEYLESGMYADIADKINSQAGGFDLVSTYENYTKGKSTINTGFFIGLIFSSATFIIIASLFLGSCFFMAQYAAKPLHILRVSAMGGDFAVEVKNYDNSAVNRLIKAYYDIE